jgi:hypothetical protein
MRADRKGGIRMDKKECKPLFSIIDQVVDTSEPLRAEYFRGYHRGIEALVFGDSDERTDDHNLLIDYAVLCSGDPYIDSYARGYRHGFEGMHPESPSLSTRPSRPFLIASIV